jgi:hypothetical protein
VIIVILIALFNFIAYILDLSGKNIEAAGINGSLIVFYTFLLWSHCKESFAKKKQ